MSEPLTTSFLPILTQQKRVRFGWIVLINFAWFIGLYTMFVMGTALPFTLRRFTDDMRLIGLVTSVGLWFGIVLGPLVNYISDRIWTRMGRRRPFLMVAACGALLATLSIPFVPALTPLILLVVVSSILGDVGSTLEPLWLEVVPPNQRGQAFAIRGLMMTMASMVFFQLMFAQFDRQYHFPGGLQLNGEQICYLSAALLQLIWLALISVFIREVRPAGVNLHRRRDIRSEQLIAYIHAAFGETRWWHYLLLSPLPAPLLLRWSERSGFHWLSFLLFPWAFFVRFVRDVFTESRWWWVYLFYVTPIFLVGNNPFATLMLVEQFNYSKPNIALTGWPLMIIANAIGTPFMAWYADRLPKFGTWLLGTLGVGGCMGLYYFTGLWAYLPKLELPPFWAMMVMGVLGAVGPGALIILFFQWLRCVSPQANPRIWAWMFSNLVPLLMAGVYLFCIKVISRDGVPSITLWFLLMCVGAGLNTLTVVAGPLIYDFIPKDKIGTLSSGFGLLSTGLGAVFSTLVGTWIYYYSHWSSGGATTKDYTSTYVMQITFGMVTLVLTVILARRMLAGKMVEYGRLGLNSNGLPPELPHDHPKEGTPTTEPQGGPKS